MFGGAPEDFDRQRRLVGAARDGDFEPSIEDALEKYREDMDPDTRNYAPKEYWPSTGAFRRVLYQAGKRLGRAAESLLQRVPDEHLRLFAAIELAAAVAGVPESSITQMTQPNAPGGSGSRGGRIIAGRLGRRLHRGAEEGNAMRSPDGRSIRCPKCSFFPPEGTRWCCKCGHVWEHVLDLGPLSRMSLPVGGYQLPHCQVMSDHKAWYVAEALESPQG